MQQALKITSLLSFAAVAQAQYEENCVDPKNSSLTYDFPCTKYPYDLGMNTCSLSYRLQTKEDQCLDETFFKLFYRPMCDEELEYFGEEGYIFLSATLYQGDDFFFVSKADYKTFIN